MKKSKITGMGYYVPERVVTNDDLTKVMNTTDEWIQERTGIKERRYFEVGKDTNYSMAVAASKIALERAKLTPQDIDLIVYATLSPDYYFPGSGVLLQRSMDFRSIAAIDLRAQCSGFIYALSVADQFIRTGMYKNVLVAGSEIHSNGLDYSDQGRHVSVIFGDGAGAVVLSAAEEGSQSGILSTHLHSEGRYAEELAVIYPSSSVEKKLDMDEVKPGGKWYPIMNGSYVFKHAVTRMPEAIAEALEANKLQPSDIDFLVPHQANYRITQAIQQKLGLPDEKVASNIHKYGNTTAASIPIALCQAWEEGRIKDGDLVCLASFGSGFTWGSALIRW